MSEHQALQPDGKPHIAASNHVLNFKIEESGREAQLLHHTSILSCCQPRLFFTEGGQTNRIKDILTTTSPTTPYTNITLLVVFSLFAPCSPLCSLWLCEKDLPPTSLALASWGLLQCKWLNHKPNLSFSHIRCFHMSVDKVDCSSIGNVCSKAGAVSGNLLGRPSFTSDHRCCGVEPVKQKLTSPLDVSNAHWRWRTIYCLKNILLMWRDKNKKMHTKVSQRKIYMCWVAQMLKQFFKIHQNLPNFFLLS